MAALETGARIGSYEIVSPIGAGGMGEVYLALDTKLKRDVAIKVLPAEWARDPERLARAQREAEVLASLNHPHIAQIYGREDADGAPCLVLEYVDGETIHDKLVAGPIPVTEALEIARQVADALGAAHERGIVHRDLKPANIKVTPEGRVKVLDFGLAKTLEQAAVDISHSPTLAGSMTGTGVIMGTSGYFSPEQIRGKASDARSDVWSFGVVLYEMLAGKLPFEGESVVETVSAVLKSEPDWALLPDNTPPVIRTLLRRCLQKDRSRRLRDVVDARFQVEEALAEPPAVRTPAAPLAPQSRLSNARVTYAALFVGAIGLVLAGKSYFDSRAIELPETRLQIITPPATNPGLFAISPDGRKLVFEGVEDGRSQLWLRPLWQDRSQPLPGTDNATLPFWSPDSASIGFFAEGKLKKINIDGGSPQTIADASFAVGGTWNSEGTILFTPSPTSSLFRVDASGGEPVEVTRLQTGQAGHRFPQFLPGGRRFLFFAPGTEGAQGVYMGSLETEETRRLFESDSLARFIGSGPGHLLFVREGVLRAQRFDPATEQLSGEPSEVADRLLVGFAYAGQAAFSVANSGAAAYRSGEIERQFVWFDRSGNQGEILGDPVTGTRGQMRLSPDGRTLAMVRSAGENYDVWLIDTVRAVFRRFTTDSALDGGPIWSPDGNRIAFWSRRHGPQAIFVKPATAGGNEEALLELRENASPNDWSGDGQFILYSTQTAKTAGDLWAVPLGNAKKPFPVVQTSFDETEGRFSPDGRWIAYQSNESGRNEIYIQAFPSGGSSTQLSLNGGTNVQWRADGKEIFYLAADNRLMAVPVTLKANATRVDAGMPVALFRLRPGSEYAATRDGRRFVVDSLTERAATFPITVILNWAGVKK